MRIITTFQVQIKHLPTIEPMPTQFVPAGQKVTFSCKVSELAEGSQLEIFYQGVKVDDLPQTEDGDVQIKTLVIDSASGSDTGSVICVAKNDLGISTETAYLFVHGEYHT